MIARRRSSSLAPTDLVSSLANGPTPSGSVAVRAENLQQVINPNVRPPPSCSAGPRADLRSPLGSAIRASSRLSPAERPLPTLPYRTPPFAVQPARHFFSRRRCWRSVLRPREGSQVARAGRRDHGGNDAVFASDGEGRAREGGEGAAELKGGERGIDGRQEWKGRARADRGKSYLGGDL